MKKICYICLMLIFPFLLSSCASLPSVRSADFLYDAADERVSHVIGRATGDGGWAVDASTTDPFYAYDLYDMLCGVTDVRLTEGAYVLSVIAACDNINENPELILEMRVSPSGQNDELIAAQGIFSSDFDTKLEYKQFDLPFTVEAGGTYDFRFVSRGHYYTKIRSIALQRTVENAYQKADEMGVFELSEEEAALTFEEDVLYKCDLRQFARPFTNHYLKYDLYSMIVALQGIVNRDENRLFIIGTEDNHTIQVNNNIDEYWFDYLSTNTDFFEDRRIVNVENPLALLNIFKDFYNGAVIWDREVPSTSNVAFTAAGVDNLLPISYSDDANSLYSYLVGAGKIRVILDLHDRFTGEGRIWGTEYESTGSAKNDAYYYAYDKYLATGKTNPTLMANYIDAYISDDGEVYSANEMTFYEYVSRHELVNRDYFVANKAFFWDLSVWEYYKPNDDRNQPEGTDYNTLCMIMKKQNELANGEVIRVGGFVNWANKYTIYAPNSRPDDPDSVPTEWESVAVLSYYNAVIEADAQADYANASIYSKYNLENGYMQEQYTQRGDTSGTPSKQLEGGTNYILIYMGDYDSPAWLYRYMFTIWNDPNRGVLPLAWPVCPVNTHRSGFILDHMYKTATANDYFVGGDNGYGYLDPFALEQYKEARADEGLKGDLQNFLSVSKQWYDYYDIDIQGILIRFYTEPAETIETVLNAYAEQLTPTGLVMNEQVSYIRNGMPVIGEYDVLNGFAGTADTSGVQMVRSASTSDPDKVSFMVLRSVLSTPTQAVNFYNQICTEMPDRKFEVLDPYTFFRLYKAYLEGEEIQ